MPDSILLISPYYRERHRWMVSTVKLAELWQRLGYRVVVICMGERTRRTDLSPTLTIVERRDLFLPDPWNYGISWGFSRVVKALVREEKPAIIVVNKILFWSSICLIGLRLRGHRVLLLSDALVGMTWWPKNRCAKCCAALYAWTLGWLIMKAASQIVFFHPQPPRLLRFLGIAEKSLVIPTGIDAQLYERRNVMVRQALPTGRQAHLDVQHDCTITYVGRLESVKGVDDFLAAATALLRDHPTIEIQVIGYYEPGHPLVEAYRDRVTFTGLREDIPVLLHNTDIFVLPSLSEGLSNALMEAMASGCACVTSEVGGNRYLIENGISGFLYPAGDREALKAHLRRLIDDPAKRNMLGEHARKRIEKHFDWSVVGEQYRAVFDQWIHPPVR